MEEIIKPYGYIYKTTNLVNGKIYIGKKKGSEFCFDYKGSGSILRLAINKYGKENFYVEPLVVCFSLEELNAEEEFLIDWFNARDPKVGYNRAKGGAGGGAEGRKWSEESRINLSLRISGEGNPNFGKSRSPETRRKISEANKGKPKSEQTRIKLSESHLGKNLSEETKRKISEANKGRIVSNDTKMKIGAAHQGKTHSIETRMKMSASHSGENHNNFGKPRSPETRRKISEANKGNQNWLGKKHSAESIAKMKEASKNKKYRKVCQNCGIEFLAKGTRTKYCDNCRKEV